MSQKRSRRRKSRLPEENVEVEITAMSNEGRGIAHVDERTVFIDQALVGERVLFKYSRLTKNIAEGRAVEILQSSDLRVEPKCSAFELCGGCSLQHMSSEAQIDLKQAMLLDQFAAILAQLLSPYRIVE